MRHPYLLIAMTALAGCNTASSLTTDLSAKPVTSRQATQDESQIALRNVLGEAIEGSALNRTFRTAPDDKAIRRYLTAGYALTDLLCDDFFRHTNTAKRRRQFGRGVTNDVGTAIQGVLGLVVGVPVGVVSGVGLTTGTLDKSWRNYDESFIVAPDLQNVRSLVLAAQDEFRRTTLEAKDRPTDYMTAQSSIIRYAGFCTFLGMQSLLTQSIDQQRDLLKERTNKDTASADDSGGTSGLASGAPLVTGSTSPTDRSANTPAAAPARPLAPPTEPSTRMNAIPTG